MSATKRKAGAAAAAGMLVLAASSPLPILNRHKNVSCEAFAGGSH